ncbi:MAG TPA: hypothetical protein DD723_05965 [Candidatus Omnitrophica bacterium]|nr:MAG: hypothetical protein A2Z81_06810 [Omnitrophica WOR_2 bacterium GWA2_45_18]OGX19551.1 MAG: hypothetical protein A2Y04_06455 [Omnitrophica WOR_2 bacterium GWC2_45_7]HBR15071.1 hypothetical protein [Candidatus Omnitrophota bacterium]
MKNFLAHSRSYILRGLIAIIPILLCVLAIQLLYVLIDKKIMGFLDNFIEIRQIPGLGIVLVLMCLYLIGLIVSNIVGHQLFRFIEGITRRIPLINTIYGIGKQLSQSLSVADSEKQAFQKAVLVKIDNNGLMVPGFLMSSLTNPKTNEDFSFVLVPTAPTPASGFVLVVKSSQIVDPGWTVEECLKAIVSVGIISPKEFKK